MKKLLLILVLISFSCSSGNVGNRCLQCHRQKENYSIGYCKKHYTLKKENKLRGLIKR